MVASVCMCMNVCLFLCETHSTFPSACSVGALLFLLDAYSKRRWVKHVGRPSIAPRLGQEYVFREWKSTDCFLLMALIEIEPLFVSTFNRDTNHFNSPWTGHLHTRAWQFWVFKDLKIGSNLPKDPPTCPSVRSSTSQEMQIWDESLILGLDTLIRDHIKTVCWNLHEITVQ